MFTSADEILKISFSNSMLRKRAERALTIKTIARNEENIKSLNVITEQVGRRAFTFSDKSLIPDVFRKFKSYVKGNIFEHFSKKELRTLTYSLCYSEYDKPSIFSQPEELESAFKLLSYSWKDSYIIGLFDCYLQNWNTEFHGSFNKLREFGFSKLSGYNGNRAIICSLKKNLRYFDPARGDAVLGNELALKQIPLSEATKYLSLTESWFLFSYFSNVIIAYYERNKANLGQYLAQIEIALLSHCGNTIGSATSKKVISKMIIQCNESQFIHLQDKVKAIAFKLIGDPAVSSNWSTSHNISDRELTDLQKAKKILNEWITRQFITVFFEKCINDDRRKRFWLKMANSISAFKVFGPSNFRAELKQDKRIAEFVDSRFQITYSQKQVAAFFMIVNEYKLIEFSDPGYAFYAYKVSNPNSPSMEDRPTSVDLFRNGYLPTLVYRSGTYLHSFSDEGRLPHHDGDLYWEQVFKEWLTIKVGIDV